MRILVVDDSVVFRSQIRASLEGDARVQVVGTANNGKIALQRLSQGSVDLITLDMEMPEMGGIETIKEIKRLKIPVRIIVFSSHTTRGSEAALEALACGADDFVSKPTGENINMENAAARIKAELLPKIYQFLNEAERLAENKKSIATAPVLTSTPVVPSSKTEYIKRDIDTFIPDVIVIGSSTGGPPALEAVLTGISKPLRCPIFITQHMPPVFTASLGRRITEHTGIEAAEAKNGETVVSNRIYIAPGDYHMSIVAAIGKKTIKLDQGPPRNSVRPAVDFLFETAVAAYGAKTMGIILTGMGEDGLIGCKAIKKTGGGVMIQDKESCVVFGMPGAVFQEQAFDKIGGLNQINAVIKRMTN